MSSVKTQALSIIIIIIIISIIIIIGVVYRAAFRQPGGSALASSPRTPLTPERKSNVFKKLSVGAMTKS